MTIPPIVKALRWKGNKRTASEVRPVPPEVLSATDALRDEGRFEEATRLLESQSPTALSVDGVALVRLALSRFGSGDPDGALEALKEADSAADRQRAVVAINRANILKVQGKFEEALSAARQAVSLVPTFAEAYLVLIAVHACRNSQEDRIEVHRTFSSLGTAIPDWRQNEEIVRYLVEDIDYARLRRDGDVAFYLKGGASS